MRGQDFPDLQLDVVERDLGAIEQHDQTRRLAEDLADQLDPMEPPAPVMRMDFAKHAAKPAAPCSAGPDRGRARSSTSTGLKSLMPTRPDARSSYAGRTLHLERIFLEVLQNAATLAVLGPGSAMRISWTDARSIRRRSCAAGRPCGPAAYRPHTVGEWSMKPTISRSRARCTACSRQHAGWAGTVDQRSLARPLARRSAAEADAGAQQHEADGEAARDDERGADDAIGDHDPCAAHQAGRT